MTKKSIWLLLIPLMGLAVSRSAHSQESYTIPDHLTPLSTWRNGYSAEETLRFRREYADNTLTEGADDGAYAITHLSEVLPAAIVHRDGQVSVLESDPMPEIADVVATTALGTMTLRRMMADKRSRMRAIAVVHGGKVVFEEYLGIRPRDNHIWASAAKTFSGLIAAQLEAEGLLDVTQPVSKYLPELARTPWAEVPVSEALHQRSGLEILEADLGKPGHPITYFYAVFAGAKSLPPDASFMDAVLAAEKRR
jgi:CubicO group peptidase (beta-lactamase class C family)